MSVSNRELGLYLHWPYCAAICPYCDFNVYRARSVDPEPLVGAMLQDLVWHSKHVDRAPLSSIFFGGGTPSLMKPLDVERIIDACDGLFGFVGNPEISLEANPTDSEAQRFRDFAAAGINRLSLGVQSLDDAALKVLGRFHTGSEARAAVAFGQNAFGRVSLDLIYARPEQTLEQWQGELSEAVRFGVEHISPYQLTIENGTAFDRAVKRGSLRVPSPDLAADFYNVTQETLDSAGYEAYEVSNHARGAAAQSRHNKLYWRSQDWIGLGPGAHGRISLNGARMATEAHKRPMSYIEAVQKSGNGLETCAALSLEEEREEFWLMGLRQNTGIARAVSRQRGLDIDVGRLESLAGDGLLFIDPETVKLTAKGRLLANSVTLALLA